jgi:hypothetical protein
MVQPINYLAQMQQVDPAQSLLQGLQAGATFRNIQQQQAAKEQAEQRLQAYRGELESAFSQGTPQAFSRLMALFPEHQAAIKPQFEQLSKERQQVEISSALPVASALLSNNPKVAKDLIEQRIRATPEGEDVSGLQAISSLVDSDPQTARNYALMSLSQIMSPDKFAETFGKLSETSRAEAMAPSQLTESQAKATTAAAKAKFAESEAALDLQKKGWDIKKIQSDMAIANQNAAIAAANVQIGKTTNELKRQELELKVDEMKQKRDSTVREKVADVEAAKFNIDNMLNTSQRILKNPKLNSVIGTIQGRVPVVLSDEAQDAVALIETLGSQAFLSQIPNVKGMGQLSNAEGEKLQNALQNLGRVQSEKQFKENLGEVDRLLNKARKNISMRYGVPDSSPDIPAANTATVGGQTYARPANFTDAQWSAYKQSMGVK